ncbi:MAG: hypothetical protein AAF546_01440 [Verrucomicrobiota bacterium]
MGFPLSDLARRSFLCAAFGVNVFLLESSSLFLGPGFALQEIFQLMSFFFAALGSMVAAGSFAPQILHGLRARLVPQDALLFAGSSLAAFWYLWMEIGGINAFNLSMLGGLAFTIVFGRWIQTIATESLGFPEEDLRVDHDLAKIHRWIHVWVFVVPVTLFLSIPFLLARDFEIMAMVEVLSSGLLIAPIHFLYEVSRYPKAEIAILIMLILSVLGLAVVLTGGLSPIGGMMFGISASLLSIAVLEIKQKLGVQ